MGVFLFILKELKEFICRDGDWRRVWHLTHWFTEGRSGEHAGDFKGARGRVYGVEKNELSGVLLQRVAERMRCGTEDPPPDPALTLSVLLCVLEE